MQDIGNGARILNQEVPLEGFFAPLSFEKLTKGGLRTGVE
jgi:hypothetical protein